MRNTTGIFIFLLLSFVTAAAQSRPDSVSVAEAERRIAAQVQYIEKRAGDMTAAFYYTGAQRSLEESFRRAGVSAKGMGYADSWGKMGIGLFWSQEVKGFYSYHLDALNTSLKLIRAQGYAKKEDLEYLDTGMAAWKPLEELVPKQFDMLVDVYTKSALLGDEKDANDVRYSSMLSQISNTRPFRSDHYDAVKAEWGRANKPLEEKNSLYSSALKIIKGVILERTNQRLFSAIDARPQTSSGRASGADSDEKP